MRPLVRHHWDRLHCAVALMELGQIVDIGDGEGTGVIDVDRPRSSALMSDVAAAGIRGVRDTGYT